jgi:hypothetical protein
VVKLLSTALPGMLPSFVLALTPLPPGVISTNVEGTVEVASRQEWKIGYTFAP